MHSRRADSLQLRRVGVESSRGDSISLSVTIFARVTLPILEPSTATMTCCALAAIGHRGAGFSLVERGRPHFR